MEIASLLADVSARETPATLNRPRNRERKRGVEFLDVQQGRATPAVALDRVFPVSARAAIPRERPVTPSGRGAVFCFVGNQRQHSDTRLVGQT
jgi:hypothetical protein